MSAGSIVIISSIATMTSGYFGFDLLNVKSLRADNMAMENSALKVKLSTLDHKLIALQNTMLDLGRSDRELRTSVGMQNISSDVRKVGIGGTEINKDYGMSPDANKMISTASSALDALDREARLQQESYSGILSKYKRNQDMFLHIPAIDPIRYGTMTDGFGIRFHPILHMRLMHEGIDIVVGYGTPVHSTGDGVISYVGRRGGYGNVVEISHGYGYTTLYGHLSKALVKAGQKIVRGQVIALSGDSGLSTGPHLHYEVRKNGVHVDPAGYFFNGKEYGAAALYGAQSGN